MKQAVRRGVAILSATILAGFGLAATAPPAAAATTTYTVGDLQLVKVDGTTPVPGGLSARSRYDIDGDGRDEVTVTGYSGSQRVIALQMSRAATVWRILAPIGDFGQSTAIGDFDGDGYGDLAVTDSRGGPSTPSLSGSVWILYGAQEGFDPTRFQHLYEGDGKVPGTPSGGRWGFTLAAADLNSDGYADLVAASQYKTNYAGSVTILRGSASGISGTGAAVVTEASLGYAVNDGNFGSAIAIGDLTGDGRPELVIGARQDASAGDVPGRVLVLKGTASGPQLSNPTAIDALSVSNLMVTATTLGSTLAIGDVNGDGFGDIVAGAVDAIVDGHTQAGAIFAFYGSATGVSASRRTAMHEHVDGVPGEVDSAEGFGGVSVGDVSGDGIDDVLVGAPFDTVSGNLDAGSAYLFLGSAQGLTAAGSQLFTQASANVPGEVGPTHLFGSGTILDLDHTGPLDALVSVYSGGQLTKFTGGPTGLTAAGAFDTSVLIPGGQSIGVPLRSVRTFAGNYAGGIGGVSLSRAYAPKQVRPTGPATIGTLADATEGGATPATAGSTAPIAAVAAPAARFDLDNDGHDDIVATGNPLTAIRYTRLGRTDLLVSPYWVNIAAVAAGDFDHDGHVDLALSTPNEHVPGHPDQTGGGAVWICPGSADGLVYEKCLHWTQDTPGVPENAAQWDSFGSALAAGDVNGDGYADLAVGVPSESMPSEVQARLGKGSLAQSAGAVHVFYGSASGLTVAGTRLLTQPVKRFAGQGYAESNDHFGTSVAIGDVTGDGYADLAVGVPDENHSKSGDVYHFEGEVDLFAGGPSGPSAQSISRVTGRGVGDNRYTNEFGWALTIADTTGDGKAEVVVGAPYAYFGTNTYGAVVEYKGSATGISSATGRILRPGSGTPGLSGQASFGLALANGDVNGDGQADVLAGAPFATVSGLQYAGAAVLLKGSSTGLTGTGAQTVTSSALENFGYSVAILNGSAVVGAPGGGSPEQTASGAIVVYPVSGGTLGGGSITTAASLVPRLDVLVSFGWSLLGQ